MRGAVGIDRCPAVQGIGPFAQFILSVRMPVRQCLLMTRNGPQFQFHSLNGIEVLALNSSLRTGPCWAWFIWNTSRLQDKLLQLHPFHGFLSVQKLIHKLPA